MRELGGNRGRGLRKSIDWKLVIIYLLLVLIGWANIYSSVQSTESTALLDFSNRSGKQFFWILASVGLAIIILFLLSPRVYEGLSVPIYLFAVFLLLAVIVLGVEVKGSRSWFEFGPVRFQPAEISKIATSLMLATVMSQLGYKISRLKDFIITALIILVPMGIIIMQSETGSALVYVGFIFMLYREGLSGWLIFMIGMAILLFILTLTSSTYVALVVLTGVCSFCMMIYSGRGKWWMFFGIPIIVALALLPKLLPAGFAMNPLHILLILVGILTPIAGFVAFRERNRFSQLSLVAMIAGIMLVFSTEYIFKEVLQEHQRKRIEVLLGMKEDPSGVGYNVKQSMIAIGSGGFTGKGYMNGTQTTFGFVPEQSTDFIFCTIGEEWGFVGCSIVILLYVFLIWRIVRNAERSREAFTRIYGYCVACCIFMHLFINVGMTLGLMPVIGIPLPLVSYGGSSLWAFTIMIFIFIALDRNERKYF
jgi:rod shape determining protein RodA